MIRSTLLVALAAGLVGLPARSAETPFQMGLALRTGYSLSTQDHLNPSLFGLGLSGDYALSSTQTLRGELAYFYEAGRTYRTDFLPAAPGQAQPDPTKSADVRKNKLEGLTLRLSGIQALSSGWSMQGGLQIGNSRFTQEYIGNTIDANRLYQDTYNGVPVKSALKLSPFAGLQYDIDRDGAVELNLIGLSYTAIEFQHTPGAPLVSGDLTRPGSHLVYAGDHLEERSRMRLAVEFSYRFRF
ncbi:hypothetical protein GETHLI_16220 [Geothrix limicola]|uniref:Outer membrane protein beta-barrel domain-containing protein n=1 Tax=Geothrix limicola TaxID=2927978 RepID=A0ABQ5QE48_9BACT|nr:hypothetical protein [Geothrix limicola]GLH73120.1 hypothetical protein GETHLI_16220 [Geothrix limicola]